MRKLIILALIVTAGSALAQDRYLYVGLDVNKPTSNTNWIGDVSTRGVKAGYRAFVTPRFSAGLDVSWSAFDQYHPTETVQNPTGAFTTDYFKYIYSYSAAVSGQYYFNTNSNDRILPYAGLGLGANNNHYVRYYNIYQDSQRAWGFLARPEAGILVKIGARRSFGIMAAVHYDYTTNKSSKFNYDNFSALGFQVGLAFFN
jgi:outer membrane protein W